MNEIKEIIKNLKEEDFFERVNLHIHSTKSDGSAAPGEIVRKAREKGLKYFSICDHNTVAAYDEIGETEGLITGVEFDCWYRGVFFHLLGYGIDVKSEALKPFLSKTKAGTELDIVRMFARRDVPKLISAIRTAGGIAVLAHPACCLTFNLKNFIKSLTDIGLEGVETRYPYRRHRAIIRFHKNQTVKKIAEELNLLQTGGTDAHGRQI